MFICACACFFLVCFSWVHLIMCYVSVSDWSVFHVSSEASRSESRLFFFFYRWCEASKRLYLGFTVTVWDSWKVTWRSMEKKIIFSEISWVLILLCKDSHIVQNFSNVAKLSVIFFLTGTRWAGTINFMFRIVNLNHEENITYDSIFMPIIFFLVA